MDGFLRQSTAVDLPIGPFLDATDGVTAETALTISQADVRLKKNNGAWAQISDNTSATHEENGWYEKEFDATDTDTVGVLKVAIHETGALPVFHTFQILEEAVYDALFAASALGYVANAPVNVAQWLGSAAATPTVAGVPEVDVTHWIGTAAATPTTAGVPEVDITHIAGSAVSTTTAQLGVNVVQISGDSTAADNLETSYDDTTGPVPRDGIVRQGTAQSATSTTLVLDSGASFADDELIGATIVITGGSAGVGQSRLITDYVNSTDTATVDAWTTTPTGTITYKIFATAPSTGGAGLDAAGIRAAVGLASANLDTQLSNIDNFIDTEIAAIQTSLSTIDGKIDTVDNFLDTEVAAILAAVDTEVAAILADTNELQTDWVDGGRLDLILDARASQTSVNTIDDFLDTEVAAIKAKTDQLTFGVTNKVDANVTHVNEIEVTGDGETGTEWGPV